MVSINNVSKLYYINPTQKGRHGEWLQEKLAHLIENPLVIFGENKNGHTEKLWALKNITFAIDKGEILGVVGANGAGKSTLLRIIAGITYPTEGEVNLHGRIFPLLRVDIGFHPELTGRENIFLSGTILGFSVREIEKEYNNITAFSGIGRFIDTPVKFYSSGMRLRLGFSIATAELLQPDILVIDDILAVGDREFYQKSSKRIYSIIKKRIASIILVSHNLKFMEEVCEKIVWLEKGAIRMIGKPKEVIKQYQDSVNLE